MTRCRLASLFLGLALPFLSPGPTTAGFDEGLAAYERGDYQTAFREFMPLAVAEDSSAQYSIGRMYRLGQGAPQNYTEAVRWYRIAAAQGEAKAQNDLGSMYEYGLGVPQDYAEAVRWFRMAAVQGEATAQNNLGSMYHYGLGVPRNDAEAVRWSRMAADQGEADAQYNLGMMYAAGQGVPQDDVRAYMWLTLAGALGPSLRVIVAEALKPIAGRLSPAQLARARDMLRNWRASVAARTDGEARARWDQPAPPGYAAGAVAGLLTSALGNAVDWLVAMIAESGTTAQPGYDVFSDPQIKGFEGYIGYLAGSWSPTQTSQRINRLHRRLKLEVIAAASPVSALIGSLANPLLWIGALAGRGAGTLTGALRGAAATAAVAGPLEVSRFVTDPIAVAGDIVSATTAAAVLGFALGAWAGRAKRNGGPLR